MGARELAAFAWAGVFSIVALLVVRAIPPDWISLVSFAFFFVIAIFASAVASSKRKV